MTDSTKEQRPSKDPPVNLQPGMVCKHCGKVDDGDAQCADEYPHTWIEDRRRPGSPQTYTQDQYDGMREERDIAWEAYNELRGSYDRTIAAMRLAAENDTLRAEVTQLRAEVVRVVVERDASRRNEASAERVAYSLAKDVEGLRADVASLTAERDAADAVAEERRDRAKRAEHEVERLRAAIVRDIAGGDYKQCRLCSWDAWGGTQAERHAPLCPANPALCPTAASPGGDKVEP
jgi:hypothetical protein